MKYLDKTGLSYLWSKIKEHVASKIIYNKKIFYGTCSTVATTADKVITLTDSDFKLQTGALIVVKFSATNTADNPTFNVNGSGAKRVWYNTALITTGSKGYAGTANRPMMFMYDGTQWIFIAWSNIQTYSNMSQTEATTGTATSARSISAKVLHNTIVDKAYPVGAVYISVNNTSPATLFGGTWEQIKDVFLVANGDNNDSWFALKSDSDITANSLKVYMWKRTA